MIATRVIAAALVGSTVLGAAGLTALPAASAQETETEIREQHRADRHAHLEERLDEAVEAGRLTEERAGEIRERMAEWAAMSDEEREAAREARRAEHQAEREARTAELAEILGTSADDLRDALKDGDSLADIAEANGVEVDEVIDHLVAQAQERLDTAVEDGRIDAERAAELAETLEERVTARVNGDHPERGDGDGEGHGEGRRFRHGQSNGHGHGRDHSHGHGHRGGFAKPGR